MLWESLCSCPCSPPPPGLRSVLLHFCFLFFPFFFSSLFHKDTYSPSPPQGFTLDTAKERPGKAGRLGRGSSHKMRCVALCVPFVIPCTMNCPGHPPAPGYTQVPHLPCSPMGQWGELGGRGESWGCSLPGGREHNLCAQERASLGRKEIITFLQQQKAPLHPRRPLSRALGGPSGRTLPSALL